MQSGNNVIKKCQQKLIDINQRDRNTQETIQIYSGNGALDLRYSCGSALSIFISRKYFFTFKEIYKLYFKTTAAVTPEGFVNRLMCASRKTHR